MLKHISATGFIETILLVTAVYYLAVATLFYRNDIRRLLARTLFNRPSLDGKGENSM